MKMVCLLDVICQAVLAGPGRAGCLDGPVRQGLPAVGTRQHTAAGFWILELFFSLKIAENSF